MDVALFQEVSKIIQEDFPEWNEAVNGCFEKEISLTHNTGDRSAYYQCNVYVLGKKGRPLGTITVLRDITEHKNETKRLTIRAEYDGMLGVAQPRDIHRIWLSKRSQSRM